MLDIDAQRRADRSGAGQPVDDAQVAFEHHPDALIGRVRAVDRIVIGEIIRGLDLVGAKTRAGRVFVASPSAAIRPLAAVRSIAS